jgi:hypothetical protein
MKLPIRHAHRLAALGLWVLAAAAHAAGQNTTLPDPGDDRAPVPATHYEPLLTSLPPVAPTSPPPDSWKELNRQVASFDSMSLTMDMGGSTSAQPRAEPAAASSKIQDPHAGHSAKPAAKPDPHSGHATMRGMAGMAGMPGMQAAPHAGNSAGPAPRPVTHDHQNMEHK